MRMLQKHQGLWLPVAYFITYVWIWMNLMVMTQEMTMMLIYMQTMYVMPY